MAKAIGFGQAGTKKPQKSPTKRERQAKQYAEMKSKGLPEFNIYVRVLGKDWLPAGSMTVERSSQIAQAIFQQEAELQKQIFRMLPRLKQYQADLEYGYRLKQFPDEPIAVAQRPVVSDHPIAQAWRKLSQMWSK